MSIKEGKWYTIVGEEDSLITKKDGYIYGYVNGEWIAEIDIANKKVKVASKEAISKRLFEEVKEVSSQRVYRSEIMPIVDKITHIKLMSEETKAELYKLMKI